MPSPFMLTRRIQHLQTNLTSYAYGSLGRVWSEAEPIIGKLCDARAKALAIVGRVRQYMVGCKRRLPYRQNPGPDDAARYVIRLSQSIYVCI